MKHILILKPDTLVNLLNFVGLPIALIYAICMFFWPWISGHGHWDYVQEVWDRWQSLNVGILAFASSITAFNIARYNAEKQRARDFLAAKAFLPAALSELVSYFKSSATLFSLGWKATPESKPNFVVPDLPREYKAVFGECIRHAEPGVGDYLSRILVSLQIHDSRMRSYVEQRRDGNYINPDKYNLITYFYRLGELQALVGKLFEFARNMDEFDSSPLNWEDFRNAYGNLNIWTDEIVIDEKMNLEAFTKRAIDRN
ncbi:hypothetical protein [Crenobacter caeni]|uniref:DUF4760 domain-containing protein n=1 Tax=Crenobacter caeni TaxID=2705474 RepID=A0A6B2KRE5_9NEIS|nr:hypothetical protein [Crenobacter caeni]NDV12728.1 hypothetical protein [Crenobacter caeni]